MKNVVVTGIFGLRNRGVEALVVPTVEQLRLRCPDAAIGVITRTPDYDEARLHQYDTKLIERTLSSSVPSLTRLQKIRAKFSSYKSPVPEETSATKAIREASIVIASGGDVFSSDYGSLHKHLKPLQIALDANVPVVFLAHSIGPFKTDKEVQSWLNVARRSKLITVRERISYGYVTEKLGLSTDLVKHTADPAFLLKPSARSTVENMLEFYNLEKDCPIIALSISQGITTYSSCNEERHLEAWTQVVKMLLEEFKVQVILVPHVQETYVSNDDRVAATNLLRNLNYDRRVRLIGADHSASEFKGLIGACDMVIAERMHAAIAGLSSGVCTVAVGYSIKAEGIMTNLLGAESVHNGLLIPIHQFLNTEKALPTIRNAWKQHQEVAERLKAVLPRVEQEAASNFDMISELLG